MSGSKIASNVAEASDEFNSFLGTHTTLSFHLFLTMLVVCS